MGSLAKTINPVCVKKGRTGPDPLEGKLKRVFLRKGSNSKGETRMTDVGKRDLILLGGMVGKGVREVPSLLAQSKSYPYARRRVIPARRKREVGKKKTRSLSWKRPSCASNVRDKKKRGSLNWEKSTRGGKAWTSWGKLALASMKKNAVGEKTDGSANKKVMLWELRCCPAKKAKEGGGETGLKLRGGCLPLKLARKFKSVLRRNANINWFRATQKSLQPLWGGRGEVAKMEKIFWDMGGGGDRPRSKDKFTEMPVRVGSIVRARGCQEKKENAALHSNFFRRRMGQEL